MIIVFGSINLDLIFNLPAIPNAAETVLGPSTRIEPGGKGANQAVAAARLGARVRMHGAVGNDSLAEEALVGLHGAGVDLELEQVGTTGIALIVVAADGENQIVVDCDVLQADGGTRTAAITGGFVALADAIDTLLKRRVIVANPLHGQVAAVSVGIYRGTPVLDLDYVEDSNAETDMNVVMNSGGAFVEVQGTAEGHAFRRHELDQLLDLATQGIAQLHAAQLTARAAKDA